MINVKYWKQFRFNEIVSHKMRLVMEPKEPYAGEKYPYNIELHIECGQSSRNSNKLKFHEQEMIDLFASFHEIIFETL